ncbi:hypothetical protein FQN57_002965 [Myotisia sp. PD_48]|nr:hypothetical protein FQN57_002965 [Myotisia sp. PD_48]
MVQDPNIYADWSHARLVERVVELDRQLQQYNEKLTLDQTPNIQSLNEVATKTALSSDPRSAIPRSLKAAKVQKKSRDIDPSKYTTRFIALKFAYLGKRYNGYEHANNNITELPTIEEELWKALRKTRLIFPKNMDTLEELGGSESRASRTYNIDWEDCQYSKCGRTDRGVSAFGQVIGIKVRSSKPKPKNDELATTLGSVSGAVEMNENPPTNGLNAPETKEIADQWDDIADELPYVKILNGALPEDIRILAWCPRPPADFSARFSCRERRYRYFFTQPAFCPSPLAGTESVRNNKKLREGWLDLDAMQEAANHYVGSHDFRNFCKVDTSKQITNFVRRISRAEIEMVNPSDIPLGFLNKAGFEQFAGIPNDRTKQNNIDNVYSFTVHGNAFLWHQIRHMVAILFLVGQGLERPSIIPELLDANKNPRRPVYEIASDTPLVLWDCVFGDEGDDLGWVYAGDPRTSSRPGKSSDRFGQGSIVENVWSLWKRRKIDEILAGTLLDIVASREDTKPVAQNESSEPIQPRARIPRIFCGGDTGKPVGKYIPLLKRKMLDTVEEQNARYLSAKGNKREKRSSGEKANNSE